MFSGRLATRLYRGTRPPPTSRTPRLRAFSSLLPASWPASSAVVFLLTDPDTLAPSRSRAAWASSRVMLSSVPVMTQVWPESGPGPGWPPAAP